jgi:hypothetical protein
VLINGGTFNRGKSTQVLFGNVNIDLNYLHLASGGGNSTSNYTSGKFILKLYGANF